MKTLNLETKNKEQEMIKQYLEENASDILADKINNGVKITKDGKTLLSKKDLNGFMKFAADEAKKQAEKNAVYACIEDKVVFGWAIHYFEEDSIEGNLFNEDGTKFEQKIDKKPLPEAKIEIRKPQNTQTSLFDFIKEPAVQETKVETVKTEKMQYTFDSETGEVLSKEEIENSFDKHTMYILSSKLEGKLEMQWGVKWLKLKT